jgi:hypothetical protein
MRGYQFSQKSPATGCADLAKNCAVLAEINRFHLALMIDEVEESSPGENGVRFRVD